MDESQIATYLGLFDLPDAFAEAQLKQAYHDLVQVWHPDKHSHNERLQKKANEKTKEINQEDNQTWARNGESVRAKQLAGPRLVAAILAPRSGGLPWDCIVLYDRQMDERRREFEREAPKRAARDL